MVKCAVNTMETILCGLKLLTQFVSSVGSNELEQMKSYTPKNIGATISWALKSAAMLGSSVSIKMLS